MTICFSRSAAVLFVACAWSLAACSEREQTAQEKAVAAAVPGAPPGGVEDIVAAQAAASDVKEANDLIDFAYAYPVDAARIPALARWLEKDRATKRDALVADARRDRAIAEKEGFPFHVHSHIERWQRITSTPRFLSLSSEIETYMGGAHGMQAFDTLIWDRNRAARRKPLDLFTSPEAFDRATKDDLCAGIERAKKARGIVWSREPGTPFADCPVPSAQTVWLGSSDGRYLDRLTIAIGPYEIGPYAEGSYKINLPMSAALVNALKPEYQRDFLPLK